MYIKLDSREFAGGRWWNPAAVSAADPGSFDPCFGRFLAKLEARPLAIQEG
jgi:hypothetical protein